MMDRLASTESPITSWLLALSMPGGPEWIFIFIIVLLLFGAKKLPELAKGIGASIREFQKAKNDFDRELQKSADAPAQTAATTAPAIPAPAGQQPASGTQTEAASTRSPGQA